MSKASMPSILQCLSTEVFGILSFQEMPQIFSEASKMELIKFFHMTVVQVQVSLPQKSMVSKSVLYTPIFVPRPIP